MITRPAAQCVDDGSHRGMRGNQIVYHEENIAWFDSRGSRRAID
jgi:hypothetical protein